VSVTRRAALLVLALITLAGGGCVRGDRYISASHAAYNEALRERFDEELLLNIVRLRYRDRPLFLQVSSVIARFSRQASMGMGASGGLDSDTPEVLGRVGLDFSYSEQPTVTFNPLQGEDFSERLLRPVDLETLALLQRSGWSIERVLRLTVQRMNGLDNASGASGPTPAKAPSYREFVDAARALKQLQDRRAVVIGTETEVVTHGVPVPADRVMPSDVLAAAEAGRRFEKTSDGAEVVLRSSSRRFVLRVAESEQGSETMQLLRRSLGLATDRRSFDLLSAVGEVEDVLGTTGERRRVVVVTRSLLGVLFFLCHAVEVPEDHADAGVVTVTRGEGDALFDWSEVTDGLLQIHSSRGRPSGAAVAVHYRGHWFYISDDDLSSKSTFALLAQLYALQSGDPVGGAAPVPTIPL